MSKIVGQVALLAWVATNQTDRLRITLHLWSDQIVTARPTQTHSISETLFTLLVQ